MKTIKQAVIYELTKEEQTAFQGYMIGEISIKEFSNTFDVTVQKGQTIIAKIVPQYVREGKIKLNFSK